MPETINTTQQVLPIDTQSLILPIEENDKYVKMPNSQLGQFTYNVLSAGAINLPTFKERYGALPYTDINIALSNDNKVKITKTKENEVYGIETCLKSIEGTNKPTIKLFMYSMILINRLFNDKGILISKSIKGTLNDLVNIGMYKNIRTARTGFKTGALGLLDLKLFEYNDNTDIATDGIVLFTSSHISSTSSEWELRINEDFNWGLLERYFVPLPICYFSIYSKNSRAGDLLYYIISYARENKTNLVKNNSLIIPLRTVQRVIGLPDEQNLNNTKRDIKDEIDNCINTIKETFKESSIAPFQIKLDIPFNPTIQDYLNKGKLIITFSEDYIKYFLKLLQQRENIITHNMAKTKTLPKAK